MCIGQVRVRVMDYKTFGIEFFFFFFFFFLPLEPVESHLNSSLPLV